MNCVLVDQPYFRFERIGWESGVRLGSMVPPRGKHRGRKRAERELPTGESGEHNERVLNDSGGKLYNIAKPEVTKG